MIRLPFRRRRLTLDGVEVTEAQLCAYITETKSAIRAALDDALRLQETRGEL